MTLILDHILIGVHNLEQAIRDYRELGFTVTRPQGNVNSPTESALILFIDGTYLELIAKTGQKPIPGAIDFSSQLSIKEGMVGFALRTDDMEGDSKKFETSGFRVGPVKVCEIQREDGRVVQWKVMLLDDGVSPLLIQDITPREWRIPADRSFTTHANRALGLRAIEIVISGMDLYKRYGLLTERANTGKSHTGKPSNKVLITQAHTSPPDRSWMDRGNGGLSQEELDRGDPANEPEGFEQLRQGRERKLQQAQKELEDYESKRSVLQPHTAGLYAVHLVREQAPDDRFTLVRTHRVRIKQCVGIPPERGLDVLKGLQAVDWGNIGHAYGPATDVPDLLRALTSDDIAVIDDAYEDLLNLINHQGSVYEASIETIPFFLQLVTAPDTLDKEAALAQILRFVFWGLPQHRLYPRIEEVLEDIFPTVLAQIHHPESTLRAMIVELLGVYSQHVKILEPLLRELVLSDLDESIRSVALQSLAWLWMAPELGGSTRQFTQDQTAYLAGLMRDLSQPTVVQFRAAFILLGVDSTTWIEEVMPVFYRTMTVSETEAERLERESGGNFFYDLLKLLKPYPKHALAWVSAQAHHMSPVIRKKVPSLAKYTNSGQPDTRLLTALTALLRDPSPEVRIRTIHFFNHQKNTFTPEVKEVMHDLAANDPSMMIRVAAKGAIQFQERPFRKG